MDKEKHQTLGNNVVPANYKISIEPNFKSFRFDGNVVIKAKVVKPTDTIKLNAKELTIKKVTIKTRSSEEEARFSLNEKDEELILKLKGKVSGTIDITIGFSGIHNDKMSGFYRSKYTHGNKENYILSTHLEPAEARAVFPCIDEPEYKATFDVSLVVEKNIEAISNMPIKSTGTSGKKQVVSFQTTPIMSTYLVYMGAGVFDSVGGLAGKTKIRVLATPGHKEYCKLALEFAKVFLLEYEKYFGIKYVLPKLDLVAVPEFSHGAMENWGAITFREVELLGDSKKSSESTKQRIAEVVSHELAHQWFGDLVTMKWWDDIWLNESFAGYMEMCINDMVYPQWKRMLYFYDYTVTIASTADSMSATHPINVHVNTPGEINAIFDEISYWKGASVLHMLEDYVGADTFRKGLQNYLKKHKYSNATKADLWDAIEETAKANKQSQPVSYVIEEWVNKAGHPIIDVVQDPTTGKFTLTQRRFTISNLKSDEKWPIPIHYLTETAEQKVLMRDKELVLRGSGKFLKLNYQQAGFYKVKYEEAQLKEIGKRIRERKLPPQDVWGVENDIFAMARSGTIMVKDYLRFVNRYLLECDYPAAVSVSGHLGWILNMGKGERYEIDVKRTSVKFHKLLLNRLGWERREGEDTIATRLRAVAIGGLGIAGDYETIEKAKEIFEAFMRGEMGIDPNIKAVIYATMARSHGSEELLEKFLKMYKEDQLPEDKIKALQSIGAFKEVALLEKALDTSLTDKVRLQDSIRVIVNASSNVEIRPILFRWVTSNWKRLMKMYDPTAGMLDDCVSVLSVYADEKARGEVKGFFSKKENLRDDIKLALDKTLERIQANAKFLEVNRR